MTSLLTCQKTFPLVGNVVVSDPQHWNEEAQSLEDEGRF